MTSANPAPRSGAASGFRLIAAATLIAGVVAYLVTWIIPREIGFESYAAFAVFWSFLFLAVAGLSGTQQEIARATRPVNAPVPTHRARNFAVVASLGAGAIVAATSPLWVGAVFPSTGLDLVWPLAVGVSGYVLVSVVGGTLYALTEWSRVFWLVVAEALLRAGAVVLVLRFTDDIVIIAWAVALPWAACLLILWGYLRPSIVGRADLDVGYAGLAANTARTVIAAVAAGVMVSGFPLVLSLTSPSATSESLGMYVVAVTFVRAPLVVVAMSLQSFLVVMFRDRPAVGRMLASLLGIVAVATVLLAVGGALVGPAIFGLLFPGQPVPGGAFIAALVGSSALMAALYVVAPVALARSRHTLYSVAWAVAAVVTIVALIVAPGDLESRVIIALVAGPVAGLVVHAVARG